jgi:hypothetical protein
MIRAYKIHNSINARNTISLIFFIMALTGRRTVRVQTGGKDWLARMLKKPQCFNAVSYVHALS